MNNTIKEQARFMKLESPKLATTSIEDRNKTLLAIKQALLDNKENILKANELDLKKAKEDNIETPVLKRLKFDEKKLEDVTCGLEELVKLPDPLFKTDLKRQLDEGLNLYRVTCPIGVIGVIFESRPDALVQIASLCLKSGNCAILKGGSEALNTNKVLFDTIYNAAIASGMPKGCLFQVEAREEITQLLACHESVDLIIPRGSNAFVQYIMNNSKIPVMGHADGICHIYVDKEFDVDKAVKIIVDAKTQYPAVCNAVETLLVHKDSADKLMKSLYEALSKKNVVVKGTKDIRDIIDCEEATDIDFETEYLKLMISVKTVDSLQAAIDHINKYGSHHTDCIITENSKTAEEFMNFVDSAGVYHNCSTRFADGFRYGFGAEVGVSTGKLHARGPVGLEGLVTYKYKLYGDGHIVDDYASGNKHFNFKDL